MNREEALLDLFIQPGWKILMQETTQDLEQLKYSSWMIKDPVEMAQRRGYIEGLIRLESYEYLFRAALDAAKEAVNADAL